jgi:hypothetical protein
MSVKKPIDRTQLHQLQSIRYNQYRSIRADLSTPSVVTDRPRRFGPPAPSAFCDRSIEDSVRLHPVHSLSIERSRSVCTHWIPWSLTRKQAADRNVGYYYITRPIVTIGCVTEPTIKGPTARIGWLLGQVPTSIFVLVGCSLFAHAIKSLSVGPGSNSQLRQTDFCEEILVSNQSLNIVDPWFNSQWQVKDGRPILDKAWV